MTTRNFQIATHLGGSNVQLPGVAPGSSGEALIGMVPAGPGQPILTKWQSIAAVTGGMPIPTAKGQLIVSGDPPGFSWGSKDSLDMGRF